MRGRPVLELLEFVDDVVAAGDGAIGVGAGVWVPAGAEVGVGLGVWLGEL
jgi:hypothetical protein